MKITQPDYQRLTALVTNLIQKNEIGPRANYPGLSATRYAFDIYHATLDAAQTENRIEDYLFLRHLYNYLNDEHLETALKAILKPRRETSPCKS